MIINPASLSPYSRNVQERAWRFNDEFLRLSGINPAELLGESQAVPRFPHHNIGHCLQPSGEGRRNIQCIGEDRRRSSGIIRIIN